MIGALESGAGDVRFLPADNQPGGRAENDHRDLRPRGRRKRHQDQGKDGDRRARPVGREALRHSHDRLGDDRDRDELEAVQEPVARPSSERALAVGEERHRRGRRQREPGPGGETAEGAGAREPNGEASLTAGRPRQELAQGDKVGIGAFVEPGAPYDELLAEIAEMRDRPAEAREAQLQEDAQDFESRTTPPAHAGDRASASRPRF